MYTFDLAHPAYFFCPSLSSLGGGGGILKFYRQNARLAVHS
jgi:hypothetical protein